ncbi:hypothetical protein [Rhizobium rhizogenes]|uniref:hypothetical protein n=1 Tax=Rhizobium rhizogenes TaxID=359 RepID=UPI00080FFB65|nr:hypothetical protein [Rhizobium rhizogenes]OCJ22469.1 hypothetical protein A6U88_29145 [Agrobacterium sp. B131/95]
MDNVYRLPEKFETQRYLVRRIRLSDAEAIFAGWATDPEVTKRAGSGNLDNQDKWNFCLTSA